MASSDQNAISGTGEESADGIHATNTGPKGVLADYQHHQAELKMEEERRMREVKAMIEKQAVNFNPQQNQATASSDKETEQFLKQYRTQKFMELKEQALIAKKHFFGHLMEIRGEKYAEIIDKEPADVLVLASIYAEHCSDSLKLNQSLAQLAKLYPTVKFICVQAHKVDMSSDFIVHGVPAILVYKGGRLLGNFVKITETLKRGEKDFAVDDLEAFLLEKDCLPSLGKINFSPSTGELEQMHISSKRDD